LFRFAAWLPQGDRLD